MNAQKKPTLKEQLNGFYGELEMPSELTDVLLRTEARPRTRTRVVLSLLGAAAAIALLAVAAVKIRGGGADGVTELALAEVAHNHLKALDPELISADYAKVQEYLERLDFEIAPPAGGLLASFDLIGGRYCKVQGEFAAQLKLRPQSGGPTATAYVVPADGSLAKIGAASTVIDGVRVRCERAGSRLVFLAEAVRD